MIINTLPDTNGFYITVNSGSKGNDMNIGAILGALAQEGVESQRIKKKVNNRSTVHFHQHDDGADANARGASEQAAFGGGKGGDDEAAGGGFQGAQRGA